MTYLLVAVAFVGAICLFDLVLTFAVLRRLRDQAAEIAVLTASSQRYDPIVLLGREVFEAVAAHDLVGFFDSAFPTCHLDATAFVAEAVDTRALAVIIGDPADIGDLLALLSPVATVLVGDEASAVARAVDIQVFPTFLRVDDGRIGHAATAVAELAEPATAA
ncbi:MAG: hypothetical protein QOI21_5851 [Actinomycetota bacterium]|jgi:hypothetical protein|nr:hypothetical protein [Actinomycetota bacterium]